MGPAPHPTQPSASSPYPYHLFSLFLCSRQPVGPDQLQLRGGGTPPALLPLGHRFLHGAGEKIQRCSSNIAAPRIMLDRCTRHVSFTSIHPPLPAALVYRFPPCLTLFCQSRSLSAIQVSPLPASRTLMFLYFLVFLTGRAPHGCGVGVRFVHLAARAGPQGSTAGHGRG
jgi:hypothetical protein